jgi:hypothetical protein
MPTCLNCGREFVEARYGQQCCTKECLSRITKIQTVFAVARLRMQGSTRSLAEPTSYKRGLGL